jgi:hypothetical protein
VEAGNSRFDFACGIQFYGKRRRDVIAMCEGEKIFLYRRAVEEFERVRKLRPELPNQPISDAEQGGAGDLVAGQGTDTPGFDDPSACQPDLPPPNEPISSPALLPGGAGDLVAYQFSSGTVGDLGAGALPGAADPSVILGKCASRTAATQLPVSVTRLHGA